MSSVDRFEIQGELGRGESSVVYRARDRLTDRLVAIKMFQRRSHESGQFDGLAARLEREARLLSRVKHSSVVEVIEARLSEEGAWLVTEYIEGESLQELLRRRERLAPEEAISLAAQAARALSCAHRNGVVHRDVKPANLLVTPEGALKVTDFGVAGESGAIVGSKEDGGYFLGTPAYVAPEQWCGKPVDGRADIYSLGVVLYRCLTGSRPFEGRTVREVVYRSLHDRPRAPSSRVAGLPPELDRICLKALARDPGQRHVDGETFARELEAVVVDCSHSSGECPAPPWSEDPMEKTWSRLPVNRGGAAMFGRMAILLCATILLVSAVVNWGGQPSEADQQRRGTASVRAESQESMDRQGCNEITPVEPVPSDPTPDRTPDPELLDKYARIGSRHLARKPKR